MSNVSLDVSDWRDASLQLDETVFAIGDVHGCHPQLPRLLTEFSELAAKQPARLIFLGDLINRGPSSLEVLRLWSDPSLDRHFTEVTRITGNHEQMLMLATMDWIAAGSAYDQFMHIGGEWLLGEMRRTTGKMDAPLSRDLIREAAGEAGLKRLEYLQYHLRLGNVVFVHGGLDPSVDVETALAHPFEQYGGAHWAWIQEPFLKWRGGFGGTMVVHGHTPPEKHRAMSGYPDPHVFQHDRLCLDGGSAATGIVAAAQFENGRYRLFRAMLDAG
jgi:serine/threonine protein phosphatase 1